MLKSILISGISLYFLSFCKAKRYLFWYEIIIMERVFLCRGTWEIKTIHWINCKTICQLREEWGLNLNKICEVLNIVMLTKWKWRMLNEKVPSSLISYHLGMILSFPKFLRVKYLELDKKTHYVEEIWYVLKYIYL